MEPTQDPGQLPRPERTLNGQPFGDVEQHRQPGQPHPAVAPYPVHAYPGYPAATPRPRSAWKVVVGVLLALAGLILSLAVLGALAQQLPQGLDQGGGYLLGTVIGFGMFGLLALLLLAGGVLLIVQPGRNRSRR